MSCSVGHNLVAAENGNSAGHVTAASQEPLVSVVGWDTGGKRNAQESFWDGRGSTHSQEKAVDPMARAHWLLSPLFPQLPDLFSLFKRMPPNMWHMFKEIDWDAYQEVDAQ